MLLKSIKMDPLRQPSPFWLMEKEQFTDVNFLEDKLVNLRSAAQNPTSLRKASAF